MATEKSALRVTELDFESIRENLKTYLRSQSEFTDYDFEGSGMAVLLDILAYNTHYMGFYLNMVGNEMFLDTAQLRASILSHAKSINYIPQSRHGAEAKININVTPSNEEVDESYTTLEKYTKLIGSDLDGVNHQFVTMYSNTVSKQSGSFLFSNVIIKQGEVISIQYEMLPENESRRFEIPSANVDTTTLSIVVADSAASTNSSVYVLAQDITELSPESKVYFLEENENLTYTFYFGDNVIGKKPINGSIITATYLDTVGPDANSINRFTFVEPIGGQYTDNVTVTTVVASAGGIDKETIEEVRFRAPYFYSTQNRAVTKFDYQSLIQKDFEFIDSVTVWGGEENDPVVYGKVFISIKPKGNYQLTNLEKEKIKNNIITQRGVLTVTPEIIEPDYVYLMIRGKIYYNPQITNSTSNQILNLVRAAIQDYSIDELNKFDSIFRKTKLETYIENADPSITGCDIKIYAQKRFKIDTARSRGYDVKFNFHILYDDENRLVTFPTIQVYDNNGILRNLIFEEVSSLNTGIKLISISNGGQNYLFSAPTVVISGDGSGATAVAKIVSGRVVSIEITNPGKNYTYASAILSGGDGSGAEISEVQLEIETGTLRSFYYKDTGEKYVVNDNAGTIYHPTGSIKFNNLKIESVTENAFYDEDYLTISATVKNTTIYPLRNKILTIDDSDVRSVVIDVIAE